ncbi:MAG: NADH-quinone oxidoreductase subunit NuoG [Acidimicrobiales bacterium]|nr:NADH-quinone oxidoreductase subunit NuoG [Acidimicrobiales bacterium]
MTPESVDILVDGRTVRARPGELLIEACERAGTYIPRFCHHSRMKPVGMCRMCIVEVDTGRGPALQPSCMLECSPGMTVDTESDLTKKTQDGVLEFLLINHPLDCPVCDKGGECPLQDQTMAFGPGESRFVEEKRHFEKPIPVNSNVHLDRERCILCDRCTRFAGEVAGDQLIHFMDRGGQTQVNTFPDQPFSSYFSGNTVQICPVGALTAAPYRFKARPWDLEEVESTSTLDSVGSRIAVQSSHDRVLRFLGLDADAVNWGWLSDKERFVFEAYDHEDRLAAPMLRGDALGNRMPGGDSLVAASWSEALSVVASTLVDVPGDRVAVLGGARMTNESQYAWAKLAKGVLGTDHVDAQLADGLPAEVLLSLPRATIDRACTPGGTIVLLGPDPKEELGALFLRLRHAIVHDGATLIELTPRRTGLSGHAAHSLRVTPGDAAGVVASLFGEGSPAGAGGLTADEIAAAAGTLAASVAAGSSITVLLGRPSLAESAGPVVDAALALHDYLPEATFLSLLRRGNVHGALDMGLAPGLLPGRAALADIGVVEGVWPTVPTTVGHDALGILRAAADGDIDVLFLLGADLLADVPDRQLAEEALAGAGTVVAVDLFGTDTVTQADVVLPAVASTELDGTFTNLEGRVSVVARKVNSPGTSRPDWAIAVELAEHLGVDLGFATVADVRTEIASVSPLHAAVTSEALVGSTREGILLEGGLVADRPLPTSVPGRDGYGLRLVVDRSMYDTGVFVAHSPSLAGLAPGTRAGMEPTDIARHGITEGEVIDLISSRGTIQVEVAADFGVTRGTVHLRANQPGACATVLIDAAAPVTEVRLGRR